jgi:hypothetical protein
LLISADAGSASAPPVFAEDFNDNSLNANNWSIYYPGLAPTVSEQSQQLQIALTPNTAAYNGVYSNSTYDLTNKMVQVESVQAVSQAGWCENFLELELNANNYFLIQVGAGNMIFRSRVNGVNDQSSIAFESLRHSYYTPSRLGWVGHNLPRLHDGPSVRRWSRWRPWNVRKCRI